MRCPDEPTTPEQWRVIAWSSIVVLAVMGSIGLCYSLGAPAAKAALTAQIRWYSLAFWTLAVAVYAAKRIVERFLE
jgi:hypothetical protein